MRAAKKPMYRTGGPLGPGDDVPVEGVSMLPTAEVVGDFEPQDDDERKIYDNLGVEGVMALREMKGRSVVAAINLQKISCCPFLRQAWPLRLAQERWSWVASQPSTDLKWLKVSSNSLPGMLMSLGTLDLRAACVPSRRR